MGDDLDGGGDDQAEIGLDGSERRDADVKRRDDLQNTIMGASTRRVDLDERADLGEDLGVELDDERVDGVVGLVAAARAALDELLRACEWRTSDEETKGQDEEDERDGAGGLHCERRFAEGLLGETAGVTADGPSTSFQPRLLSAFDCHVDPAVC